MIPNLRERKRYMAYEIISDNHISNESATKSVMNGIKDFLGTYGMAKAGIMHVKPGILRVGHTEVDRVKAALALIHNIEGKNAIIRTKYVSGSLDKTKSMINGGA